MDVVISFDSTGSMFPALTEVRRKVTEFATQLFNDIPDLRIGIIAHGDYDDHPYDVTTLPLTTNLREITQFVNRVQTTHGFGNGGEAYGLAMKTAREFNWTSDKRVFIMLGDENVHERGTRVSGYNRRPMVVTEDWREEAVHMVQSGITMYMVKCLNNSESRRFHAELPQLIGTPLLHLHQFNNVTELLYAIAYKTVDNERLSEYGESLETAGRLNVNLAALIDSLLNEAKFATNVQTRYAIHANNKAALGLIPVEPTRFQVLHVDTRIPIKTFVEDNGIPYKVGRGFYKLTKREEIQENKEVILVHESGDMFTGAEARNLIGLPFGMRDNRSPYNVPRGYTAYVQSTSVNRALMPGTTFLYET